MTAPLRFSFACLVALMVAGCGGGSSSSGGAATRAKSSVPTQAEFYDADGVLVSRMAFQYPDNLTIDVQLQAIGSDMLWGTADDASQPYLQCLYLRAKTPLLRYPDLYFLGMGRSPTGGIVLAELGIPSGGLIKCPVRRGRRLQQEFGHVASLFAANQGDGYSYLVNAELEHFAGTATEVIDYQFTGFYSEEEPEPDLPVIGDHTQTTTVTYDDEQRPLSLDLVVDSPWAAALDEYCINGPSFAVDIYLFRTCYSVREGRRYRYAGDNVELDVQRYNGSHPGILETFTAVRQADSVTVYRGTSDAEPTSATRYESYPLNGADQVMAMVGRFAGADGLWGTEDDSETVHDYHYDSAGRLHVVRRDAEVTQARDYYPDGKLKQIDEFDGLTDLPAKRTLFTYEKGITDTVTVQWRAGDPDNGYALQTRMVMAFAPSNENWPALFSPIKLFPETPPVVEDLMSFQPIR